MTPEQIRDLDYEEPNGDLHTHNELEIIIFREIAAQLAELNARLKDVIDPREGTGWGAEVRVTTGSCGYEG